MRRWYVCQICIGGCCAKAREKLLLLVSGGFVVTVYTETHTYTSRDKLAGLCTHLQCHTASDCAEMPCGMAHEARLAAMWPGRYSPSFFHASAGRANPQYPASFASASTSITASPAWAWKTSWTTSWRPGKRARSAKEGSHRQL